MIYLYGKFVHFKLNVYIDDLMDYLTLNIAPEKPNCNRKNVGKYIQNIFKKLCIQL